MNYLLPLSLVHLIAFAIVLGLEFLHVEGALVELALAAYFRPLINLIFRILIHFIRLFIQLFGFVFFLEFFI